MTTLRGDGRWWARAARWLGALLGSGLVASAGCNAILDNTEAETVDVDAAPDAPQADTSGSDAAGSDAALEDSAAPGDAASDAEPTGCLPGTKPCFGQCVLRSDPAYGCAGSACSACSLLHATATCAGGECAVKTCSPGYADCNQAAADGCETDLAEHTHCGTCNAACAPAAPLCVPTTTGSFTCGNDCTALAPTLCGKECVDLTTSVTHCGACTTVCATPANGQPSCVASVCSFTCDSGFHACGTRCASNADPATCGAACTACAAPAGGGATCSNGVCGFTCNTGFHTCGATCASNTDIATCGTSCAPCPGGAHAMPTCDGAQCGLACAQGFADCDRDAANGCEISTGDDEKNCGGCGHVCDGTCTGGTCHVPVDAGGD